MKDGKEAKEKDEGPEGVMGAVKWRRSVVERTWMDDLIPFRIFGYFQRLSSHAGSRSSAIQSVEIQNGFFQTTISSP